MKDLEIYIAVERFHRLQNEQITSEIGLREEVEDATKLLLELHTKLKKVDPTSNYTMDELIERIDEVALQIEDAVEDHRVVKNTITNSSTKISGSCLGNISRFWRPRPDVAIKQKLRQLMEEYKSAVYKYHQFSSSDHKAEEEEDEKQMNRIKTLQTRPPDYIGGGDEVIELVIEHLIKRNNVSLCGIGGVGKTTLAQHVFNLRRVRYEFTNVIWVTLASKNNSISKDILVQILRHFTKQADELYANEEESKLVNAVADELNRAVKSLIILDDVWSTQVLDDLHRLGFLQPHKGDRILVTTRKRQVAEYGTPKRPFTFTVHGLAENGAWDLFMHAYHRYNGGDKLIRADMEEIGKAMVQRCGGHPVAIIKLAQVLADRESLEEWNAVHQHLMSILNESVLQVLAPSFDDLPDHLKLCFLYLGLWPEDSLIDVEKLYHLWIVEGLIKWQDMRVGGASLNVAERYLTELEKVGMVEVEEHEAPTVTRLKFCRLHKMMRLLCISKGNQTNFIQFLCSDSSSSSRNRVRRLSLCLESPEYTSSIDQITKKDHLHSLYILDPHKQQVRKPVTTILSFGVEELKLLRLLDFDGINFGWDNNFSSADDQNMSGVRKHSTDLILQRLLKLVHLKYLSFKRCFLDQLSSLPISNLQTLDLRVDDSINEVTLPNVLWKMRKIKHLYLPRMFRTYNGDKLRLDGMSELETLDNFITKVCNVTDLQTMTKLHSLSVKIDGDLPDLQFINEHLKKIPSNGRVLLSIDIRNFDCFVDKRHSLIREVLQYPGVRIFCIEGHINELPSRYNISSSLTKIVLIGSELEKDPMQKLSKLPNLRVLVLDDNAFEGTNMISPASCFTELRRLELLNLKFLESWTVENDSMPKLSNIKIENCNKLKIPDGLKFLTALKEFEIPKMPNTFEQLLRKVYTTKGNVTGSVNYVKITFPISGQITISKDEDEAKASSSGL